MSAVLIALVGLALTSFWFGVSRRRRAEAQIGVQSLANLKWRDSIGIVLEWLQHDGYRLLADSAAGGTEFLLGQHSDKVLLDYKHGTAYRIGDIGLREFEHALRLRGANRGILVTLGSIEGRATQAGATGNIQLIDGAHLWGHVRPYVSPSLLSAVRAEAAAATRKGLWTGALASVLAGAAFLMLGNAPVAQPVPVAASPVASAARAPTPAGKPAPEDAMLRKLNATAEAMAEVARLTPEQLTQRRAAAAKQVSQIAQVDTAAWSAQSTLLIALNSSDGKDKVLIEEACRILVQNEEMRFTRIQLNPPPDSPQAVRWRLCE
jgi:hypothetical protein